MQRKVEGWIQLFSLLKVQTYSRNSFYHCSSSMFIHQQSTVSLAFHSLGWQKKRLIPSWRNVYFGG